MTRLTESHLQHGNKVVIQKQWDTIISSSSVKSSFSLRELIGYRELLLLFVKRDIVTIYKQTILGPIWYFVQPVMTTIVFTLIFGKIAKISTEGLPPVMFYLIGITFWNYFSECLNKTSSTFITNQGLFGKVYFPRIIMPLSVVISGLGKFFIQFTLFLVFFFYYLNEGVLEPNFYVLLLPIIVFIMALISLGFGMLFSSMTTKYRDLKFLLSFGVQLWMYATPIIYPISSIPSEFVKWIKFNPIAPLIEFLRHGFFGVGEVAIISLIYSFFFGICIFILGYLAFNKIERTFMDTI